MFEFKKSSFKMWRKRVSGRNLGMGTLITRKDLIHQTKSENQIDKNCPTCLRDFQQRKKWANNYGWVMVPNFYGMSQFSDIGLFTTKPYISGSNYIKKNV